ncbi:MAG: hypothetical protein LBK94_04930 [Prevotellaceae bacterium]|jgi:hypothetical protein|nr:hypothetical protein [Prevotellaceae bacterium]
MNKIEELKYYKENGLLISLEKYYIPSLETSMELWFNTFNKNIPTKKQINVFNNFLKINQNELNNIIIEINNLRDKEISINRIIKKSKRINCLNELQFDNIIFPRQNRTKNKYLLFYATTDWRIPRSEFTLEIEILFKNNKLELVQEHSGLWTRLEWDSEYNSKE